MARLVSNGYVRKVSDKWALTQRGSDKLEQLGPAKGTRLRSSLKGQKMEALLDRPVYDPHADIPPPVRPGSEDFLKYPSRIANTLYYRDGRVEFIGEKNGH